jgi:hypothetical protein
MEEKMTQIPFIAYESSMTRMERIIKRLVVALIISIFLMFISNALWLYAWMQYDYTSSATTTEETVTVDGKDGIANYIGNDGDIANGTNNGTESKNNTDQNKDGE